MTTQIYTLPPTPEQMLIEVLADRGIHLTATADQISGATPLDQLIKEATR